MTDILFQLSGFSEGKKQKCKTQQGDNYDYLADHCVGVTVNNSNIITVQLFPSNTFLPFFSTAWESLKSIDEPIHWSQ